MLGQLPVFFCYNITGIMRGEPYFHCIPDILPHWVMVHFFGLNGYPGHKSKGFAEIGKGELAVKAVVFFLPHNVSFLVRKFPGGSWSEDQVLAVPDFFVCQFHYQLNRGDGTNGADRFLERLIRDGVSFHQPEIIQVSEFG